ncbi:MAG: membrane protein [Betaproteobacteria bacterium]|nr:MAG: membrane protein [Betaproteobacteria bacterium]
MPRIRDPRNFGCALMFLGLAALLAHNAFGLAMGTASAMGPGYFPLALAIVLGVLGLVLAVQSLRVDGPGVTGFAWRPFVLVTLALVAFGVTITRLGFVPAVLVASALGMSASRELGWRAKLLLGAVLLAFCWAVFVLGLGLPVRMFGR